MRRLILSVSSWEEKRSSVSPEEGVEGFLILQPVKNKAERGQQMLLNLFKLVTYLHLCIIVFMLRKTGMIQKVRTVQQVIGLSMEATPLQWASKKRCQNMYITGICHYFCWDIYAFNNGNLTRSCSSNAHLFLIYNVHPSQGQVLCSILYPSLSCSQETINWPVFCVPLGLALSSCINL